MSFELLQEETMNRRRLLAARTVGASRPSPASVLVERDVARGEAFAHS
jgi:hypothetical protein